ncbi:hypothetical protein X798_06089 [Onchocerca flexuosa]|uniref:Uncharacterized protein n=1 Tax=Onchocerca flexuosa TaxID=387005 RepID=A0A238BPI0_9BILA|nr:hypothetical protein X798_06089 [Onchocerca flexuosa]
MIPAIEQRKIEDPKDLQSIRNIDEELNNLIAHIMINDDEYFSRVHDVMTINLFATKLNTSIRLISNSMLIAFDLSTFSRLNVKRKQLLDGQDCLYELEDENSMCSILFSQMQTSERQTIWKVSKNFIRFVHDVAVCEDNYNQ